jgi:hypothetical protein
VEYSRFQKQNPSGKISNITIDNVDVIDGLFPASHIFGAKPNQIIRDIEFIDVDILGKPILKPLDGNFVIKYSKNVTFSE